MGSRHTRYWAGMSLTRNRAIFHSIIDLNTTYTKLPNNGYGLYGPIKNHTEGESLLGRPENRSSFLGTVVVNKNVITETLTSDQRDETG